MRPLPGRGIDASDRAEVADAWRSRMAPNLDVPSGWSGSVRGCIAGDPSDDAQRATLESINFVRAMAGLDPVAFSGAGAQQTGHRRWVLTPFAPHNGYGQPTLVFQVRACRRPAPTGWSSATSGAPRARGTRGRCGCSARK